MISYLKEILLLTTVGFYFLDFLSSILKAVQANKKEKKKEVTTCNNHVLLHKNIFKGSLKILTNY